MKNLQKSLGIDNDGDANDTSFKMEKKIDGYSVNTSKKNLSNGDESGLLKLKENYKKYGNVDIEVKVDGKKIGEPESINSPR